MDFILYADDLQGNGVKDSSWKFITALDEYMNSVPLTGMPLAEACICWLPRVACNHTLICIQVWICDVEINRPGRKDNSYL